MNVDAERHDWALDVAAVSQLGTAVMTAQMFETLFVLVARTVLKSPSVCDFEDIAPFSNKAFKQPVGALVKELSTANQVGRELAERINVWVENRHRLIHRHYLENAPKGGEEYWRSMKQLSRTVFVESSELCSILIQLFESYAEKLSQHQSWLEEHAASLVTFKQYAQSVRSELRRTGPSSHG